MKLILKETDLEGLPPNVLANLSIESRNQTAKCLGTAVLCTILGVNAETPFNYILNIGALLTLGAGLTNAINWRLVDDVLDR